MPKRGRPESTSSTSAEPKTLPDAVEALVAWLRSNGASLDGLAIRANADSSYGLYATTAIPADAAIGNLPTDLILDPLAVLANDKVALASIKHGGTPAFSFWLALAAARKDPQHRFAPYLAALPLEAPDPCAWPASQRMLLDGTPLAPRVEGQRRLLADEHRKIAPKAAKHVSFEDLLWARGVHLSRCFPRALVDASRLSTPHEVLASNAIDGAAALTVEHGGTFSAPRVAWRDDSGADAGGGEGGGDGGGEGGGGGGEGGGGDGDGDGDDRQAKAKDKKDKGKGKKEKGTKKGRAEIDDAAGDSDPLPSAPAPAASSASEAGEAFEEHAAGNLGCMLPLYDMFDHKVGHPIGWEAGCGGVRFRNRVRPCVLPGAPLYNNYGPKGNQELLFTYGFSVADNPLDTVEGIIVGCAPSADPVLSAERRRLLDEQGVEYTVRPSDGALLIGPFDIFPPSASRAAAATDAAAAALTGGSAPPPAAHEEAMERGEEEGGEEGEEDSRGDSYFSPELLFALQVAGMDDAQEGPMLTLDELDQLRATLNARLAPLLPAEAADAKVVGQLNKQGFVAAYRDGQRRVLRAAIAEVQEMAAGAEEEEGEEE